MNRARVLAYVMLEEAYGLLLEHAQERSHDPDGPEFGTANRLADAIDAMWETMLDDEEQRVANEVLT